MRELSPGEKKQLQEHIDDYQRTKQKHIISNSGGITVILIFALILGLFVISAFFPGFIPIALIIIFLLFRITMSLPK